MTKKLHFFYTSGQILYKSTLGHASYDLYTSSHMQILPEQRVKIPTELYLKMPVGYLGEIRPLSSQHSLKKELLIVPTFIDSTYIDAVFIIAMNLKNVMLELQPGDKVAQMVINSYESFSCMQVSDPSALEKTERGEGGFGHTGSQ